LKLASGEVRATNFNGQPALGAAQLRFVLAWSLFPKRTDVFTIFGTSIWISVAAEGDAAPVMLGQAMPETAWCEESRDGEPFDRHVMYRLNLPQAQLLALEEMRHARGLVFTLDVRGNSSGPEGLRTFDQQLQLPVNVSDWVRILNEAGFSDLLLVGVRVPAKHESHARAAAELVRRAHEHLVLGPTSAAVAECRRAIESLWKSANLTAPARDARKRLVNMDGQSAACELFHYSTARKSIGRRMWGWSLNFFDEAVNLVSSNIVGSEYGHSLACWATGEHLRNDFVQRLAVIAAKRVGVPTRSVGLACLEALPAQKRRACVRRPLCQVIESRLI
jgi:hypothetical protein